MRGGEGEKVKGFLAFLWDVGLAVGNSVQDRGRMRERGEARRHRGHQPHGRTARVRIGGLCFARMQERTGPRRIWSSRRFFEAKMAEQRERHRQVRRHRLQPGAERQGGAGRPARHPHHHLGRKRRHFGAETLSELVDRGFLTSEELDALESGRRFLWGVRFALHVLTQRRRGPAAIRPPATARRIDGVRGRAAIDSAWSA